MTDRPEPRFRLVMLAPVLAFVTLLAWALASPIGASPDDDYHLSSIWCASVTQADACTAGPTDDSRIVPAAIVDDPCYATQPTESALCQEVLLDERPTPTEETLRVNLAGNYPPIYYSVMSAFVGPNVEVAAFIMRVVNILLFVGITTALFVLLPRDRRVAMIGGWAISTVPLGLFLLASNNPSAWSIIGVGSLWVALLGYFESTGRRRIALGTIFALAAIMAVGSRADSAFYAAVAVAVVVMVSLKPTRSFVLACILPAAAVVAAAISFLSSRQSSSGVEGFGAGRPGGTPIVDKTALLISNIKSLPDLLAGPFGTWSLGWFDTTMPAIVVFGAVVAFIAVAFTGLSTLSARQGIGAAIVAAVLVVVPLYVLYQGSQSVGQSVQPRYLLPLIVLLSGLLLVGRPGRSLSLNKVQLTIVVAALSGAQMIALHTNMRRYITGVDNGYWNLDSGIEWWWDIPFSPMFVLIIGSAAYTALLVILAMHLSANPPRLRDEAGSVGRRVRLSSTENHR